jgi:hypothetical protein
MTYTDDIPPLPSAAPAPGSPWDQCDNCQAPLDERQRYCVACGSRRAQADDPVARYFVSAARSARSSAAMPTTASRARSGRGAQTALVLALLPLTAGIGVVVGRSANNGDELLAEALKAQKAPIVNVGSGGGSDLSSSDDGGKDKGGGSTDPADGEVLSTTRYGSARKLTDAKVTPEQLEESKQAIEKIVNSKGKEYVEQQRGLPDQIIIP